MPVITPAQFQDNVFTALRAFWADRTPISYPNVEFDPEAQAEYLEVQLIGDPAGQVPIGTSVLQQTKQRTGTIALSIFVRENTSLDRAYELVDAALSFLDDPLAIAQTTFSGLGKEEVGPDGVFYQMNVTATYIYYSDKV